MDRGEKQTDGERGVRMGVGEGVGGGVARDIAQWHKNGHQSPVQHNLCGIHHFLFAISAPPKLPPLLFPVHFSDNPIN